MCIKQKQKKEGFTLIEALVLVAVISLIIVSFYLTLGMGIKNIIESRMRLAAISLANQKMEILRSLDYDNIGTQGGIPAGNIPQNEDITIGGKIYHINTYIHYIDDSFDGTASDTDLIPTDYKEARITVSWGNAGASQQVFLVSEFVPPGVETNSGGGTLRINVMDSEAAGIANANIHLVNTSTGIDLNTQTDSTGTILLPGTPAGSDYHITVSKTGYETVTTLGPSPESPYNPVVDEHATVVEGSLNVKSIIEDPISNINLTTQDPLGNNLNNIDFHLEGGRELGTKVSDGEPGYNFDQDLTTDSNGKKEIDNISPGNYIFTLGSTSSNNYQLIKIDPGDDNEANKFNLSSGTTMDIAAILADKNITSLLVLVTDSSDSTPLEGAQVHLYDATSTYDVTVATDKYGQAYFPSSSDTPLSAGDYNLDIHLDNYNDDNTTITITSNNLLTKEESLEAS